MRFVKHSAPITAAGILLVVGASAQAGISDVIFEIRAENALGSAVYQHHYDPANFDAVTGSYEFVSLDSVSMKNDQGQEIATFNSGRTFWQADPSMILNFSVESGSLSTTFTITSPLLSFAEFPAGTAYARAFGHITATDMDSNGVTMEKAGSDPIYTAQYNGAVPGGTVFADLFGTGLSGPNPGDSPSASDSSPGGPGYTPISEAVSDLNSRFRFTLTPNDDATGESTFEITDVPAPGVLGLFALGGVFGARRRRAR